MKKLLIIIAMLAAGAAYGQTRVTKAEKPAKEHKARGRHKKEAM